ncbi:MAG TPA: iron-containing alcohol dehydrogenase [Phycisphaerae bacterium]|nr:iron-containing alcohol dehydrogenase [Phycisphaerae bacterium]
MSASVFRAPERFLFGAGAIQSLGTEARRFGERALLVTGRRAMAEAGFTDRCLAILGKAGVAADLFDQVEPEPDVTTVDRCREALRAGRGEVVIGLGGGSALDAAKVAAGLANETRPTRDFHAGRAPERRGLAMIAVPTTSGTGSEMTNNGVITDRAEGRKASIRDDSFVPAAALVDPELSVPCPPRVTASSGVDALVQAVESYLSRHATPMTEAVSLRAAEELAAALPAVVHHGDDLRLRTRAAWGSAMAGLGLSNARLGVVHGLAHPLGVRYGIPHGLACGVLWPAALEFNRPASPEKFARLAELFGAEPEEYARDLLAACGLPARLTEYGLRAEDFDAMAEEALASGSTKANPRAVAKADAIALIRAVA